MDRRAFLQVFFAGTSLIAPAVVNRSFPFGKGVLLLETPLAGVTYYQLIDVRTRLRPGDVLRLQRQPDNRYDALAIEVYWQEFKLGYLPRRSNAVLARLLDAGHPIVAELHSLDFSTDIYDWVEVRVYSRPD